MTIVRFAGGSMCSKVRQAALAGLVLVLGYRSAWGSNPVALCHPPTATGTHAYTLSLPATSPITNSTQLLDSLPGAVAVLKFNRSNNRYWRFESGGGGCWVHDAPPFLGGFLVPGQEPGAAPHCFTVNPGEGFVAVSNVSTQFPVAGVDSQVVINLQAAQSGVSQDGTNLISLRYTTVAADAKDLMDDIGFDQVINVQRYLASTDTIETYTGRMGSPSPAFPIVPGEAYWVRVNTGVSYIPSHHGGSVPVCSQSPSTYSITGSATTSDYSFALFDGNGTVKCWRNCASLPMGANASQIAQKLALDVNLACTGSAAARATESSITIWTLSGLAVQELKLGNSDCANTTTPAATCQVPLTGACTFNPTITFTCGPDGTSCDDGNACSINDTCSNGVCVANCYCANRPSGMVGWWPGDGNANDISGGGHNGNFVSGATTAAGRVGSAFNLDGTNDYVQVPGYLNSMPVGEVTVVFWQKVSAAKIQSTFSQSASVSGAVFNAHVPYNNGTVYWDFGDISTGGRLSYMPPVSLVGTWQHFALVASQSGNYMRIFRNGVLEAAKAGMTPFVRANVDLDIGGAPGLSFGGQIDEFSIYNRALSASEIKAQYDASAQGVCKQCTDADGDGYGLSGDICSRGGPEPDCAPNDPTMWSVPDRVTGLTATKTAQPGTIRWSWNPGTGGTVGTAFYEFARAYPEVCLLDNSPDTEFTESAIPPSGTGWIFGVGAANVCGDGAQKLPVCP